MPTDASDMPGTSGDGSGTTAAQAAAEPAVAGVAPEKPQAAAETPPTVEIDLEALEARFVAWPLTVDGVVYPSDAPRLTQDVYDRAIEQWVAAIPPGQRQVKPPSWLIGRPLPVSPPAESLSQWFACFGRRDSDSRAYIGLGVIETDGSEREERYHPAMNTRLHALLERYLTETAK